MSTISTLQQLKDLDLNRFLQEELPIREAILNHGIQCRNYISILRLSNILDDEEQAEEMDFGWEDLNTFLQKHNIKITTDLGSLLTKTKGITPTEPKPSNFTKYPWASVLGKTEYEIIAQNIMVILGRTGNEFRKLDWEEYRTERKKDTNFHNSEKTYFDKVIPYCESYEKAITFSKHWNIK